MVPVRHNNLTPREREVALLVERNLSNDEIARQLGIKPGTVKIHVHNIFVKGGLSPRSRRSSNGRKTDCHRADQRSSTPALAALARRSI